MCRSCAVAIRLWPCLVRVSLRGVSVSVIRSFACGCLTILVGIRARRAVALAIPIRIAVAVTNAIAVGFRRRISVGVLLTMARRTRQVVLRVSPTSLFTRPTFAGTLGDGATDVGFASRGCLADCGPALTELLVGEPLGTTSLSLAAGLTGGGSAAPLCASRAGSTALAAGIESARSGVGVGMLSLCAATLALAALDLAPLEPVGAGRRGVAVGASIVLHGAFACSAPMRAELSAGSTCHWGGFATDVVGATRGVVVTSLLPGLTCY